MGRDERDEISVPGRTTLESGSGELVRLCRVGLCRLVHSCWGPVIHLNTRVALQLLLGLLAIAWLLILGCSGFDPGITVAALAKLPLAVAIVGALGGLFSFWAWKFSIFKGWLVKVPALQGQWSGEI